MDLEHLLQLQMDFTSLIQPFTTEEIDVVVKSLPSDKAPGQMGLTPVLLRNIGQ